MNWRCKHWLDIELLLFGMWNIVHRKSELYSKCALIRTCLHVVRIWPYIFGELPAKNTICIYTVYLVNSLPKYHMYIHRIFGNYPAKNTIYIHHIFGDFPAKIPYEYTPYFWWTPCQKYRMYSVYTCLWPTLPGYVVARLACHLTPRLFSLCSWSGAEIVQYHRGSTVCTVLPRGLYTI